MNILQHVEINLVILQRYSGQDNGIENEFCILFSRKYIIQETRWIDCSDDLVETAEWHSYIMIWSDWLRK